MIRLVDICLDHKKNLGIASHFNSSVLMHFTIAVLPFGFSSTCFCFIEFMRPSVKRWRSMRHGSIVYLDEGFVS